MGKKPGARGKGSSYASCIDVSTTFTLWEDASGIQTRDRAAGSCGRRAPIYQGLAFNKMVAIMYGYHAWLHMLAFSASFQRVLFYPKRASSFEFCDRRNLGSMGRTRAPQFPVLHYLPISARTNRAIKLIRCRYPRSPCKIGTHLNDNCQRWWLRVPTAPQANLVLLIDQSLKKPSQWR